jgi:stage III sporulation protein AB
LYIKGIAAGLILFSTGAMGLTLAKSFSQRVHNLRQLISFIQVLESEIQFARKTLPSIITAQAPQLTGEIGRFLANMSTALQQGSGEPFGLIWEEGLKILALNGLPVAALEDLQSLGELLGTSDVTEQIKHLKVLLHRLNQALESAEEEREKQTRLWQYLGFSAGLLLCLLLL